MNLLELKLADEGADRVRRSHAEGIRSVACGLPAIIAAVELQDGVSKSVAHGLGRAPRFVTTSTPRGSITTAGYIVETRPSGVDRSKTIVLKASGFGATVTVDLLVMA